MSQAVAFLTTPRAPATARVDSATLLFALIVSIGVIAPLLLVAGVDLTTADPLLRAHRIVHGCQTLALCLATAVLASLLYVLGLREAQLLASPLGPYAHLSNA